MEEAGQCGGGTRQPLVSRGPTPVAFWFSTQTFASLFRCPRLVVATRWSTIDAEWCDNSGASPVWPKSDSDVDKQLSIINT